MVIRLIGEELDKIDGLSKYEYRFREGDTGELRLYVKQSLSQEDIERLESEIRSQGVVLTAPIVQDARVIVIKFQKAIAPLLIIAGVVGTVVVGLIGWQLFKDGLGLPLWAWIAGGVVAIYALSRRKKWLGNR